MTSKKKKCLLRARLTSVKKITSKGLRQLSPLVMRRREREKKKKVSSTCLVLYNKNKKSSHVSRYVKRDDWTLHDDVTITYSAAPTQRLGPSPLKWRHNTQAVIRIPSQPQAMSREGRWRWGPPGPGVIAWARRPRRVAAIPYVPWFASRAPGCTSCLHSPRPATHIDR